MMFKLVCSSYCIWNATASVCYSSHVFIMSCDVIVDG
uniref:Uncharacterized protein n=1 Tax=Aegilops tauschii subsp. strangulata TaxID=200361 RepID=A0A453L2N8_AEGTS